MDADCAEVSDKISQLNEELSVAFVHISDTLLFCRGDGIPLFTGVRPMAGPFFIVAPRVPNSDLRTKSFGYVCR